MGIANVLLFDLCDMISPPDPGGVTLYPFPSLTSSTALSNNGINLLCEGLHLPLLPVLIAYGHDSWETLPAVSSPSLLLKRKSTAPCFLILSLGVSQPLPDTIQLVQGWGRGCVHGTASSWAGTKTVFPFAFGQARPGPASCLTLASSHQGCLLEIPVPSSCVAQSPRFKSRLCHLLAM